MSHIKIKKLLQWYPKYGQFSIWLIVMIQGIRYLFFRRSNKLVSGWHPPIANELTKHIHGQSYRIIDMSQPLILKLGDGQKNIQFDEDIYPLV